MSVDPAWGNSEDLGQALAAVGMPPGGVRVWLEHLRAFGEAHGGARYYADLFALLDRCQEALDPCS